jgi:hypothetical protein
MALLVRLTYLLNMPVNLSTILDLSEQHKEYYGHAVGRFWHAPNHEKHLSVVRTAYKPLTSPVRYNLRGHTCSKSVKMNIRKRDNVKHLTTAVVLCLSEFRFVFIPADISITATSSPSRKSSTALRTSSSTPVRYTAGSTTTSNFYCFPFFRVNDHASKHHTKPF